MKRLMQVVACMVMFWMGMTAQARTMHLYYTDPQGSVLAKTDAQGHILARYDYQPYGSIASGTGPNGPGYTGHVDDPEAGLIYMQARYDSPSEGRFLSPDPVGVTPGNVFSFNRYDYADNNPIVNDDPTGMCSSSDPFPCESTTFESGGDGGGGRSKGSQGEGQGIPSRTPASMRDYFVGVSTADRIKAAMAVMDYYKIDYKGIKIFYSARMTDNAGTFQQGQLILGEPLFHHSFGLIGAMLAHEVEGHWDLQLKNALFVNYSKQASYMREVQAYRYELSPSNIRRFELTPNEVGSERAKLNRYYYWLTPANKELVNQGWYKP